MAANNIIPGQSDINVRYFYLGKGAYDAKLAVLTLAELNELILNVGSYYTDGDLVWVSGERKHYIINVDGSGTVTTEIAPIGGGGPIEPPVAGSGFLFYGGQQNVYDYTVSGLQTAKPSTLGYGNNDLIVSSGGVTAGIPGYEQYNVWRVEIHPNGVEGYVPEGTIKGVPGDDGQRGQKGDKGESFTVQGRGTYADMPDCSTVADGYAYLVTSGPVNVGLIYFASVPVTGQCGWSNGVPFGKGDPGASVWTVFRRSTTALGVSDRPTDNTVQENVGPNWSDGVPDIGAQPGILYMSQATYAIVDDTTNPPTTTPDVFSWSIPVLVEGENGLDGREGRDAGFWVVWSEGQTMPAVPTNKPVKDGTGADSWTADPNQTWFDDIDANDPAKDQPRWMAQISYLNASGTWDAWQVSQIGGEKPPYKINLFARAAATPAGVTTAIPYMDGTDFTTGPEAATLVNADAAGDNTVWSDAPPIIGTPPPVPAERLYFIEVSVGLNTPNTNWTTPVELDGAEGDEAGIWSVWTDNNTILENDLPYLPTADTIIDNDSDTISLPINSEWYDSATGTSVWMANTYFRKGAWSAWQFMRVKGEKGEDGASFSINDQGSGAPTSDMYCTEDKGFAYLDSDTSKLYFKTTDPSATGCNDVGWTTGVPFGKGDGGENYYNIFSAAPPSNPNATPPVTGPAKPVDGTIKEDAVLLPQWNDAPPEINPASGDRLWMSTTSYSRTAAGVVIGTIKWSNAVMIDGEEGANAGYWAVWNESDTYTDLQYIRTYLSNNDTVLNLSGTGWIDDTVAATGSVVWMATAYYRPWNTGDTTLTPDANGRVWTEWVYVKVLGEDGSAGVKGDAAYTYIPSTVFLKKPVFDGTGTPIDLSPFDAIGGCLDGSNANGFTVNMSGGILIDGNQYTENNADPYFKIEDGIPSTDSTERVWMLQGVFNSNDNLCADGASHRLNWSKPSLLKDTAGMDYEYHRGVAVGGGPNCDYPAMGTGGFKPLDPESGGCWFSDPDDNTLETAGGAYWIAQKNWSEGPSAQWKVYKIKGEDGKDSTPTVFFSNVHPYNPNSPTSHVNMSDLLADPSYEPTKWTGVRDTSDHFFSDSCSSYRASYYVCQKIGDNYIPIDPMIDPPPRWVTLHDPATGKGGYEVYRIEDTTLSPSIPQHSFFSKKLIKWGHIIDTAYTSESAAVRLSIVGDSARFTDAGLFPDTSTKFISGLTGNKDVICTGYPSIYIINWKDAASGNKLYMKYRISLWGYSNSAVAVDDLNDALVHFKSYKFQGENYHPRGEQLPSPGELMLDSLSGNPMNVVPGSTWYIGVSEYDWFKDPQALQQQYVMEMNLDGTVKSWGFLGSP